MRKTSDVVVRVFAPKVQKPLRCNSTTHNF